MSLRMTLASVATAFFLYSSAFAQSPSPLSVETSKVMEDRIAALMAKAESTQSTVLAGKKILAEKDPAKILESATRETNEMLTKYNEIISEFKSGGDINGVLLRADKELEKLIEKYRANPNTRDAAQVLEGTKARFAAMEKRRDALLQEAQKQVRQLEANKDRIEAWMVVRDYQKLEGALESMFSGLGELNEAAKKFSTDMGNAAKGKPGE